MRLEGLTFHSKCFFQRQILNNGEVLYSLKKKKNKQKKTHVVCFLFNFHQVVGLFNAKRPLIYF